MGLKVKNHAAFSCPDPVCQSLLFSTNCPQRRATACTSCALKFTNAEPDYCSRAAWLSVANVDSTTDICVVPIGFYANGYIRWLNSANKSILFFYGLWITGFKEHINNLIWHNWAINGYSSNRAYGMAENYIKAWCQFLTLLIYKDNVRCETGCQLQSSATSCFYNSLSWISRRCQNPPYPCRNPEQVHGPAALSSLLCLINRFFCVLTCHWGYI